MTVSALSPGDVDSVAHLVVVPELLVGQRDLYQLDDVNGHHLHRVLRVRAGELVTLTDGFGAWVTTVVDDVSRPGVLRHVEGVFRADRPVPGLEVGFALTKAEKPEWVIQKLTELGITAVVPLIAERSVVRWEAERAAKNVARFHTIAREAIQQSRQIWLPTLHSPQSLTDFAGNRHAESYARCDRGGGALDDFFRKATAAGLSREVDGAVAGTTVSLVVGPEGGWSPRERELVPTAVELVASVLRAETAALVAGALLVDSRRRFRGPS